MVLLLDADMRRKPGPIKGHHAAPSEHLTQIGAAESARPDTPTDVVGVLSAARPAQRYRPTLDRGGGDERLQPTDVGPVEAHQQRPARAMAGQQPTDHAGHRHARLDAAIGDEPLGPLDAVPRRGLAADLSADRGQTHPLATRRRRHQGDQRPGLRLTQRDRARRSQPGDRIRAIPHRRFSAWPYPSACTRRGLKPQAPASLSHAQNAALQ